jgi:acetyl esterase
MQRLLQTWSSLGAKPIETLTAEEARGQPSLQTAVPVLLKKLGKPQAPQSVAKVETVTVPGADGDVPAVVYTPAGTGPFPVLVYFHGGGWVLGGIEEYDASARALANAGGCVVVSVGYRQAPENPYPAAINDAYAAFRYISGNASEFGGDSRRVAVGGEGSGANLASVVCLMAMENRGRMPVHQVLICPITDANFDSPSFRWNVSARPYSKAGVQWFFKQYLGKRGSPQSPYVSILRKSAIDLPSATVIVAELDPLRSQGEAYHKHLMAGAVDSEIGIYSGVTADFFGTAAVVAKAKRAADFAGRRLRKAFTINRPY